MSRVAKVTALIARKRGRLTGQCIAPTVSRFRPGPAYFGVRDALAAAQKTTAQSMPSVQPENELAQK